MSKHDTQEHAQEQVIRPLARELARELTAEETALISGGRIGNTTHATGPGGDDPGDPGEYV